MSRRAAENANGAGVSWLRKPQVNKQGSTEQWISQEEVNSLSGKM